MTLLLRALVSWLLALGWAAIVSLGALCLGFGNFVVAWQSFTAQGFEQKPLRNVPILGAWAEAFGVGEAPLAALFAFMLTLVMNVTIATTAKALGHALRSYFDRRQVLRSPDAAFRASASDYLDTTIRHCVWAAVLVIASILIIAYDVAQFRFRYENLFSETSDPTDLLSWAPDTVARLGFYLAAFIRTATWGYIACVVAMAVGVEYTLGRAAEAWHAFHNALEQALVPGAAVPAHETQDASPATETAWAPGNGNGVAITAPPPATPSHDATTQVHPAAPEDPAPVSPPSAPDPPAPLTPRGDGATVDVIVDAGRIESFQLAEVQANGDRFVRDGSGRMLFLRTYWDQVMGNDEHGEAIQ